MINNMDNNIYDSARLYDDIHWWKKNDMNFWSNIYKETKSRSVLELAAGTGRLAHVFLQEGAYYTGLEINQNFVLSSQKKILHSAGMCNEIFSSAAAGYPPITYI